MQSAVPDPSAPATRLLLTNLHPSVAAHHLREHLQNCPPKAPSLTDLKVLSRSDGSSRCIAFAGFSSPDDADRVRRWTTGAWVAGDRGGARIKADWARATHDERRPAKRLKRDQTARDKDSAPGNVPHDRFSEFMAVMTPSRPYIAGASSGQQPDLSNHSTENAPETARPVPSEPEPVAAVVGVTQSAPEATLWAAALPNDGAAFDDALSDADYLARRMKRRLDDDANAYDTEDLARDQIAAEPSSTWVQEDGEAPSLPRAHNEAHSTIPATQKPDDLTSSLEKPALDTILETGRLFLRNLPFTATADDIEKLFGEHGHVAQVHLPLDKQTGAPKGLAYVTYTKAPEAVAAYTALDGTIFQGRLLHVLPAVGRKTRIDDTDRVHTLKEQRLERRKQSAGQSFTWGALYLNTDATLSAVAERLGVQKSALLDPAASDPAVKVALAEAHTLAETKRYFEDEHVNVAAFSQPGPRSSTCILVKNLPFATSASSLHTLFSPHGRIRRLLVPPSGLIAIVEMEDAPSASAAWRALVYKQFSGNVLYLEKAPAAIFATDAEVDVPRESSTIPPVVASRAGTTDGISHGHAETAVATLFVKNLNFSTTTPRLRSAFDSLPDVVFARVQTKPDPAQPGRALSMGFGFVGFRSAAAAAAAKDARQGYVLDGHALEVRFAQRDATRDGEDRLARPADKASTKLLVKNVPFEATRADLRQLFSAYGTLKSVRLPRKMDNKTRGFGFLEFATHRDAEAAFAALEHTHLLGRHLVLQWAGEEDASTAGEDRPAATASQPGVHTKPRKAAKAKFAM